MESKLEDLEIWTYKGQVEKLEKMGFGFGGGERWEGDYNFFHEKEKALIKSWEERGESPKKCPSPKTQPTGFDGDSWGCIYGEYIY